MLTSESRPYLYERNYLGGSCCFIIGTMTYILGYSTPFWPAKEPAQQTDMSLEMLNCTNNSVGNSDSGSSVEKPLLRSSSIDEVVGNRLLLISFILRSTTVALLVLTAVFTAYLFAGLNEMRWPRFLRYSGITCGMLAFAGEIYLWTVFNVKTDSFPIIEILGTAFCTIGGCLCLWGGYMLCSAYYLNYHLQQELESEERAGNQGHIHANVGQGHPNGTVGQDHTNGDVGQGHPNGNVSQGCLHGNVGQGHRNGDAGESHDNDLAQGEGPVRGDSAGSAGDMNGDIQPLIQ